MKKTFLVIGNPIDHSLSPKLHNYWIKKYKIDAVYEKKLLNNNEIEDLIFNIREETLHGINVTVPFKKTVIPFLDELSEEAKISQSVNTIYKKNDKIMGDNTDIEGFKLSLEETGQETKNRKVLILGAGGVVPSIIIALKKMQIEKIYLSNRTELKAKELKKNFPEIELIKWGETLDFNIREEKIHGINVTVPFKKIVIPFLDELSEEAKISQSVNTIYKKDNKILGDNTDIEGFKLSLEKTEQEIKNKKALILGAGGVVPSIIIALKKMQIEKIYLSNRTELKAKELKENFPEIELIKWGETLDFDIIINATSIGLKEEDEININYQQISKDKFFYDVIYNPPETNFLKNAKKYGGITKNGKMMFIYQAQKAFFIWHKVVPEVDNETINLLDV